MNKHIEIYWEATNYCKGECSYCPSKYWGKPISRNITEYVIAAQKIIDHYTQLDIDINWNFNGGEPLDFFDFPELLKLCKQKNAQISLESSGGKMWLNWWAVEPYIDNLKLNIHYWQNTNLIKFILQVFEQKNKIVSLHAPIRHDHFKTDLQRIYEIEKELNVKIKKFPLYINNEYIAGLYPYSETQLKIFFDDEYLGSTINFEKNMTFAEKYQFSIDSSPSYTGLHCNVGLENLYIDSEGWMNGSHCGNTTFGNIFENHHLPQKSQVCKMISCISDRDQKITKFSS